MSNKDSWSVFVMFAIGILGSMMCVVLMLATHILLTGGFK